MEPIRSEDERVFGPSPRPDLGDLSPGSTGDATVLELEEGEFDLVDVTGQRRQVPQKLRLRAVALGGRLWHEA